MCGMTSLPWVTTVACIGLNVSCVSRHCGHAPDAVDSNKIKASAVRLLTTFWTASSRPTHPTRSGLLTWPLYRQEVIFGRAGLAIPRSTLGAWVGSCGVQLQALVDALKADILTHSVVHADETPVQMLKPGTGKTHRAYLWAYAAGAFEDTKAVVTISATPAPERTQECFWGTGEEAWSVMTSVVTSS